MFCILKHYLQEWVCQILEYSITSWWRKKKEVGSGRGTLGLLHVNKNQITGTCGFISVPLPLLQHFCVSKFLMALWMSIHLRTKYICYSSNNISHDIKSISRVLFQGKQIRWEMIWNLFFFFWCSSSATNQFINVAIMEMKKLSISHNKRQDSGKNQKRRWGDPKEELFQPKGGPDLQASSFQVSLESEGMEILF